MLDANFINTHFPSQIKELGEGAARADIRLHDGASLSVRKLGVVTERYVLLEVYPEGEGNVTEKKKAARRKPGGTDDVFWDKIALPYEAIAYVLLTVTPPHERPVVGFHGK